VSDSSFAASIRSIMAEAPAERHRQMVEWHGSLMRRYGDRLGDFTDEDAERTTTDGRTLALVVGHITGWETWLIQAAGEVLSGCGWPEIMELRGYLEGDGERRSFETIDEFNAAQARLQSDWPWRRIREQSLCTSATLYALYTTPGLLTPDRLEATREYAWSLQPGTRTPIPVGWFLWGVVLEHMAFDHAVDLGLST
jgi:hypothetical protein